MSVILLNLTIAILGLAFFACLLFSFVTFLNAHIASKRVQGQPYHATTFQVTRPYYQQSAGMHGPDIAVYASGMVEGKKEWMNLIPYLHRVPRGQAELNDSVPPGTVIPVYLFPNLKGQSRIQVIDVLPPGDIRRHAAQAISGHEYTETLLMNPAYVIDHLWNALGWNAPAAGSPDGDPSVQPK